MVRSRTCPTRTEIGAMSLKVEAKPGAKEHKEKPERPGTGFCPGAPANTLTLAQQGWL